MTHPETLSVVGVLVALAVGSMIMITLIPWDENPQKKSKKRK